MHKKLVLILSILALLLLGCYLHLKITGFGALAGIGVAVGERISGRITIDYKPFIELGNSQRIYTEFTNTGTSGVTARMEVKVYAYLNGTLKPLAYYYDSSVRLEPGMRRGFTTVFTPPFNGLYYIQARGYYDNRVVEAWRAFTVHPPVIFQPVPVYEAPPAPTLPPIPTKPEISLEYPEQVKILQGKSTLTSILVKNIGGIPVNNLRMYVSTSSLINFSINPKQVTKLSPGTSLIFLVSIEVPTTPLGVYPFDFEVMSDEVKKSGKIMVEVYSIAVPEEEEIDQTILSYEFLVYEIEREIISYHSEGYDVRLANQSLMNAKSKLQNAKELFKLGKFDEAKKDLQEVKKYLEDAILQLASATIYVYAPRAVTGWLILLILLMIILALIFLNYLKKRRERRPRLLRGIETEG